MSYNKIFEFTCGVKGFHHYRHHWHPEPDQILNRYHECNNPIDRFAIKFCEAGKEETIGHIPMEISRVTKYFMDRSATVKAQLAGVHYRRSPLAQAGLEISCKITVTISGTVSNLLYMEKYKDIVTDRYIEPKNEEIMGSFIQAKNDALHPVPTSPKKKKLEKKKTDNARHKDIRDFFSRETRQERAKKKNSHGHNIITIDYRCNILYVMIYVRKRVFT